MARRRRKAPGGLFAPTTANEILYDRSIRHAINIERLRVGEAARIDRFLREQLLPDLRKKIQRLERINASGQDVNQSRHRRLQALYKELDEVVQVRMSEAFRQTRDSLRDIAVSEGQWTVSALRSSVPSGLALEFNTPGTTLLRSIVTSRPFQGRLLREWYSDLGVATKARVRQGISIGLAQGESIPAITRRVRGATDITRRHATTIVRTAVNHVSNHAAETTYAENQDIVKGVQYIATLDDRTTLICASLDGQVSAVNEGPRPPQHHQCRSRTTPVLKSWKELGIDLDEAPAGTRASMNGQVSAQINFQEWLRSQSRATQNRVLGPGRAELWRSGKVSSIRDLVRQDGRPLTLAQVRRREGLE